MTDILIRGKFGYKLTLRENDLDEGGKDWSNAVSNQECQGLAGAKGLHLEPSERVWSCQHLDFRI